MVDVKYISTDYECVFIPDSNSFKIKMVIL